MDTGKAAEFDTPSNLLYLSTLFKSIVEQSHDAAALYHAANKKAMTSSTSDKMTCFKQLIICVQKIKKSLLFAVCKKWNKL